MKFGIDRLRAAVRSFSNVREGFLQRFSADELLQLHACWQEAEWDFSPDTWEDWQVRNAVVHGITPMWDANGVPVDEQEEAQR